MIDLSPNKEKAAIKRKALQEVLLMFIAPNQGYAPVEKFVWTSTPLDGTVLSTEGTVYIIYDKDDVPFYVGQTDNMNRRFHQHSRNPTMQMSLHSRVEYITPDIWHLSTRLGIETALIAMLRPRKNKGVLLVLDKKQQLVEIRWGNNSKERAQQMLTIGGEKIAFGGKRVPARERNTPGVQGEV